MNLKGVPFFLNDEQIDSVERMVREMSLAEKAGQLFCVLGDAYQPHKLRELVSEYHVGGVLFRPDRLEETRKKYASLDVYARIPLLKAANLEEGGAGVITDGTHFGSQLLVSAANDPECTRQFARACAQEGKQVGVNWTFSPVVDIDYNFRNPITNVRTFGSDPERVLKNASIYVAEIQKNGVAASCKHFPGDGVDYRDQHLHPTYNDLDAQEWFATYGRIYETLIREGMMSVMVGHIVAPKVIRAVNPQATKEDELPASLSYEMLTGVLRERFCFEGVIITDATIMGGYTMSMARESAIPTSIQAGCDMLCFSTDIYEDIEYMKKGIETGILTKERLDEAVMRILALKMKVTGQCSATMLGGSELRGGGISAAQSADDEAKIWRDICADRGITLVKDTQSLIPVRPEDLKKVRLVILGEDNCIDGSIKKLAGDALAQNGFEVEDYDPFVDDLHGSRNLPKDRLTLIFANFPTASNNTTVRINWCPKHAMEIPRFVNEEKTAFISLANPYHLQDIPRVRTYINAYGATEATIRACVEKLAGKSVFQGNSPVDAFCGLKDTRY